MTDSRPPQLCRRHVLGGAAVLGAAPLLAACGAEEEPPVGSTGSGDGLVAASAVEVGGGVVLGEQKVVVTQPAEGEFKGFSAVCTHQGCLVESVSDGKITCPCHGSQFSVEDGSVVSGPASSPLESIEVTVEDGQVVQG